MTKSHRKLNSVSSKIDSAQIAREVLDAGLMPVPLGPRSKRPSGGPRWNKLRISDEEVDDHFQFGQNVGILWGVPSNWAVDVDLDCEEAVAAAPTILPETYVYGRGTRPASHYIYRSQNCTSRKWLAPDNTVLVEIRSTGTQSVWVGSMHPDGDMYRSDHEVEILDIPQARLHRLAGQLAAVVLLARAYPRGGVRHDFIHALTGALVREGRQPEEVRRIVMGVLNAADDRESERAQRIRTLENTLTTPGNTYGWKSMANWIEEKTLKRIREFLKSSLEPVPTTVEIVDSRKAPKDRSIQLPEGLVADVAEWAKSGSYVFQPAFDLAVGLVCTALASGNRYVVANWRTPLQPYVMVLAPTGGGKDSALQTVFEFSSRVNLRQQVFQGFQSFHTLLDSLAEPPSIACWLWDEAARKLKTAGRSSGSQDYAILTHLLSMYGRAATGMPGMPGRNRTIPPIDRPFLITMAAAQPTQMMEAITAADLSTGLLSRFLLLDTGDVIGDFNHSRVDIFPARIENYLKKFRDVTLPPGGFVEVDFANASVFSQFKDYAEYARREMAKMQENAELWNRANQNALVIAGLLAIGQDPFRPIIDSEMADYALELSSRSVGAWIDRLSGVCVGEEPERQWNQVADFIRNCKKYSGRAHRKSQKALAERGLMPKSLLHNLARRYRGRDLDDTLRRLLEAGVIAEGMEQENIVYWWRGEER